MYFPQNLYCDTMLLSERTTHIALSLLFQTLGFILGPGVTTIYPFAEIRIKKVSDDGEIVFDKTRTA